MIPVRKRIRWILWRYQNAYSEKIWCGKNRENKMIIWREIEETNSIIQFFLIFFLFQVDIHLFIVYKNRSTPRQWILVPYSLSVLWTWSFTQLVSYSSLTCFTAMYVFISFFSKSDLLWYWVLVYFKKRYYTFQIRVWNWLKIIFVHIKSYSLCSNRDESTVRSNKSLIARLF